METPPWFASSLSIILHFWSPCFLLLDVVVVILTYELCHFIEYWKRHLDTSTKRTKSFLAWSWGIKKGNKNGPFICICDSHHPLVIAVGNKPPFFKKLLSCLPWWYVKGSIYGKKKVRCTKVRSGGSQSALTFSSSLPLPYRQGPSATEITSNLPLKVTCLRFLSISICLLLLCLLCSTELHWKKRYDTTLFLWMTSLAVSAIQRCICDFSCRLQIDNCNTCCLLHIELPMWLMTVDLVQLTFLHNMLNYLDVH